MEVTRKTISLTHVGVQKMLNAAVMTADSVGQPQCIVIVDASGCELAVLRMTGSKFLSLKSARAKAVTAASIGGASTNIPDAVRPLIALASDGNVTGLPGGLPIVVDGEVLGGIGIGSGSGDQDIAVANAALAAIGAETFS